MEDTNISQITTAVEISKEIKQDEKEDTNKSSFFQDDSGNSSSMRLYCFIALVNAIIIQWYAISQSLSLFPEILLWLSCAFAPKAIQKFIEIYGIKKENKN